MFCSAGKRVGLLLRQTCAGPELELFVVTCVKAPLLATLEDLRELRSLWSQLHDLTVIMHQNKTWLYTSSPPPPLLRSVAVPTGRKPRHRGQRGGTLWPSSWFGWTGDQDTAALCVLHNLGTAWRTTRQLDEAEVLVIPRMSFTRPLFQGWLGKRSHWVFLIAQSSSKNLLL